VVADQAYEASGSAHSKYNLAVRTLFLTCALCVALAGCGDDKKTDAKPDKNPPAAKQTDPAPARTGEVKRMSPSEGKKEVDRAGKEYTDKVDKSLDM
jgi:hypothetical protein